MNRSAALRARLSWLGGVFLVWSLLWLLLGLRFLLLMGKSPHPFLPQVHYTGVMMSAVATWALGALASYLFTGLVTSFVVMGLWNLGRKHPAAAPLGFWKGSWIGLGTALLFHGWLYWQVPMGLTTIQLVRQIPMGLVLLLLFGIAAVAIHRGLALRLRSASDSLRLAAALILPGLLLQVPHDLLRSLMPRPATIAPEIPRVVVLGIDGCRQDALEQVQPNWKAPAGVHPVVAVPATRLTWNMLLGADPELYTRSYVIPFRSEFEKEAPTKILSEAKRLGLSTAFLIDDSTTLSFGLTNNHWGEVLEPYGGWKHFFTVGAGTCWPVYSWIENHVSPVETTNPWSDVRAFFRDVGRALERHHGTFAHTCQLHAPNFIRRDELQALSSWKWLLHPAEAYECYQSYEQAEADGFRRVGPRGNPENQYRIRLARITNTLKPILETWQRRFPNLSGVLTSDHGAQFVPVFVSETTYINKLTAVHGFQMNVDTVRVPLYPFGRIQNDLKPGDVFSWFDLRDCLWAWVHQANRPLKLQAGAGPFHLSFPTVQAVHVRGEQESAAAAGAGIKPTELARATYLMPIGLWCMDDMEAPKNPVLSHALVFGDRIVTLNPVGEGQWWREEMRGYQQVGSETLDAATIEAELTAFKGRRPTPLKDGVAPPKP